MVQRTRPSLAVVDRDDGLARMRSAASGRLSVQRHSSTRGKYVARILCYLSAQGDNIVVFVTQRQCKRVNDTIAD